MQHFHNTFIILLYFMSMIFYVISSKLLQVVIGGQKSNFIGKFKLEPITIYHI